jgi:hypothetical protein
MDVRGLFEAHPPTDNRAFLEAACENSPPFFSLVQKLIVKPGA